MNKINWWKTSFGEKEIQHIAKSVRNKCISQGKVTEELENNISDFLGVEHVVMASSGSTALLMALMTIDIKHQDEVIMPNRTWIATAHAAHLLGAKVIPIDVMRDVPIIDDSQIEKKISSSTKVIFPLELALIFYFFNIKTNLNTIGYPIWLHFYSFSVIVAGYLHFFVLRNV